VCRQVGSHSHHAAYEYSFAATLPGIEHVVAGPVSDCPRRTHLHLDRLIEKDIVRLRA